jgi:hypothetical protein
MGVLTVIKSVFEAGEGWLSGGRSERSRDNGGDLRALLDGLEDVEAGGDEVTAAMVEATMDNCKVGLQVQSRAGWLKGVCVCVCVDKVTIWWDVLYIRSGWICRRSIRLHGMAGSGNDPGRDFSALPTNAPQQQIICPLCPSGTASDTQ